MWCETKTRFKKCSFYSYCYFLIGVFASIFGDNSNPELVQSDNQGDNSTQSEDVQKETEEKTVFNVGETAALMIFM